MMRKALVVLAIVAGAAIVALAVALITASRAPASLEFGVRDAGSGAWVWDLTASLQNRYVKGYFQSDAGPIVFRLTDLSAGDGFLDLSAPSYEPVHLAVHLKPGANRLEPPIRMKGLAIPGLDHFLAFETAKGSDLLVQLRPVSADGKAILNHPCLPIWVAAEMYTEVKNGAPVRDDTEKNPERGGPLFQGVLEWRWDPAPETQFRYTALLPGSSVTADPSPFRVVDYVIVVPDPRKVSTPEVTALLQNAWSQPTPAARRQAISALGDRVSYFTDTSWNVKAGTP